jgi:hypothetical protein
MYLPAATVFLVSHLNRAPQEATALLHNDTGQVAYPETRTSNDFSAAKAEPLPMGLYVM